MSGTRSGHTWDYIGYAVDGNGNPAPYPAEATPDPTLTGTRPYRATYTHTEPGFQRGNPNNDDSYMFLTLSVYKKFKMLPKATERLKQSKEKSFLLIAGLVKKCPNCHTKQKLFLKIKK